MASTKSWIFTGLIIALIIFLPAIIVSIGKENIENIDSFLKVANKNIKKDFIDIHQVSEDEAELCFIGVYILFTLDKESYIKLCSNSELKMENQREVKNKVNNLVSYISRGIRLNTRKDIEVVWDCPFFRSIIKEIVEPRAFLRELTNIENEVVSRFLKKHPGEEKYLKRELNDETINITEFIIIIVPDIINAIE